MEAKTFTYYMTERHGYVETTRAYLRKLKISKLISPYSKQSRSKVYLEEDGDLRLFIKRHTVAGIEITLKEAEKEQIFFDNMLNYKDEYCEDKQYDGFKEDWTMLQRTYFTKPDSIKHVVSSTFETSDGKCLKIVPAFFLDGKLLNETQLKRLGIELTKVRTDECEVSYDD
jgi:hypothetical protein